MTTVSNCIVCGCQLFGKQRSFCSVNCKNKFYLNYESVKDRAEKRKNTLLTELGGQCSSCGFEGDIETLSFYDTAGKSLHISINMLANSKLDRLKNEVSEARLLCRNCAISVEIPGDLKEKPVPAKDDVAEKFSKFIKTNLDNSEERIVVAVSGGVDSVTLLDLFVKNWPNDKLYVAHMDHGMRDKSFDDAQFVREIARSYGLNYISKRITPANEGNLEEYFRDERRKFLRDAAKSVGATMIALGHNADDQAETVIMNLVRGSGQNGLGGMKEVSGHIARPLLRSSRSSITAYATSQKLRWQEDKTNTDTAYSRNYIRHQILPLLTRLNPEYLENIGRSARIQQDLGEYISGEAKGLNETLSNALSTKELRNLSRPILFETFEQLYENAKGDRKNLSLAHLLDIEVLITDDSGTKEIELPGGYSAVRTYDKLEIVPKMRDNMSPIDSAETLELGEKTFNNFNISVRRSQTRSNSHFELLINNKDLPYIQIRATLPGDRIDSFGVQGKKKLQDLHVNAKIDRVRRKHWPVFIDTRTNEVIWVPGLAIAKRLIPNIGNILIKVSEENNEKEKK